MPRSRARQRLLSLVFALALPSFFLVPLIAEGEGPAKKSAPAKAADKDKDKDKNEKYDPENITAISQYMETIVKGNEKFVAKDYTAAIDTYKKAVLLSPKHPLGHYLLAEAFLQANNLGEAEAALKEAQEATGDPKNVQLRARVLFLTADLYERQKKWEQAKTAWQAYAEYTAKFADAGNPQSSAERLKAIQKVLDNEKAYVAVRERIAAEKIKDAGAPAKK